MADLISRAAAMDLFMGKPPDYYHTSYIVGELNCLPAVDAEPVRHAGWRRGRDQDHIFCGLCGTNWGIYSKIMKYCGECGAKMDGGVKCEL